MKKIFLLLVSLLFLSCSQNTEDINFIKSPSWLQGTWRENITGAELIITKGDISYNGYSFGKESQKSNFKNLNKVQVITDNSTSYIFDYYGVNGGVPLRFIFINKNNKQLESKGHIPGLYTKK